MGDAAQSTLTPAATVEGTVAHVLFSNDENGWCVVRCRGKSAVSFTAVGPLLGVQPGDRLRLTGRWVEHAKFGQQLEVTTYVQVHPTTIDGMRRFLGSGRIKGLGPVIANRLVDEFGLETIDVIESHPRRLRRVNGIGAKRAEQVSRSWQAHRGVQQVMIFLTGHGVAPGIAIRVHKRYGASALEVTRENPYRLAEDVHGVGFLTADRIAQSLGVPPDAPQRLDAGILFALQEATADGHVFLPHAEVLATATRLLRLDDVDLGPALERVRQRGMIIAREQPGGDPAVYLKHMELAEAAVAQAIDHLMRAPGPAIELKVPLAVRWYERHAAIELAERQRQALRASLDEKVVVITGGPGTGKTTLIRGVTQVLTRKNQRILLAAPTGRAAKRLQEATGVPARTIHRLLEFHPASRQFARDRHNPLEADVVVVDEASMLDIELAAHLVRALPPSCRLVLVGDADQLPSVGPGNVLRDIISSGAVPVVRLDEIFRQAAESLIVVNAHRVNNGEMPLQPEGDELSDFYFIQRDDPAAAADTALELIVQRIPRRFRYDAVDDIQLLAPMHRGELGVKTLNERLRAALNPHGPELVVASRRFRAGDKVMQIRNNYELEVFNGDLGRVVSVDQENREIIVDFDGRLIPVAPELLEDLVPAYAVTIHKSQGSEYPAVVVALHHQHHIMLQRNLLYTAITRGRRLVIIVGSRRALHRAIGNAAVRHRNTLLAERLRELRERRS